MSLGNEPAIADDEMIVLNMDGEETSQQEVEITMDMPELTTEEQAKARGDFIADQDPEPDSELTAEPDPEQQSEDDGSQQSTEREPAEDEDSQQDDEVEPVKEVPPVENVPYGRFAKKVSELKQAGETIEELKSRVNSLEIAQQEEITTGKQPEESQKAVDISDFDASGAATFALDASGATAFSMTGGGLTKALSVLFGSGQAISGINILSGGEVDPNGATLENSTIDSTTEEATGSLAFTSGSHISNVSGIQFKNYASNSRYAIYIPASITGTIAFDNFLFDAPSTGFAVYWAGTSGTLTINAINGTNLSTAGCTAASGGTVVVINQKSKAFTGLPENTEVRVRQGSYTLEHIQNVTGGTYTFYHDPDNSKPARVQFTLSGYVFEPVDILLDSNSQSIPVTVKPDPSYI